MTPTASNPPARKDFPTATALEYRLPVYPVGRNALSSFKSAHGELTKEKYPLRKLDENGIEGTIVRGNIGGRHRDMLDAILAVAKKIKSDLVGRVHVVFDVADVRAALGMSHKSFAWADLREYLLDLQCTAISIRRPGEEWPTSYTMISVIGESKDDAERKRGFPAKLKKITFSEGFVVWLDSEARLFINKEVVRQVLALQHQVSRNAARWLLSHSRDQHPAVDHVLLHAGINSISERQRRKYIAQLTDDDAGLKQLGIEFDSKQLHYRRNSGVFIEGRESTAKQEAEQKTQVSGTKKPGKPPFPEQKTQVNTTL